MKGYLVMAFLVFAFISGCGIISRPINKAFDGFFHVVIPDTCDLHLIEYIADYRKANMEIHDFAIVSRMHYLLDYQCQESYDSINIIPYGVDSVDLWVIKNLRVQDKNALIPKYYRIVFDSDTTKNINILSTTNSNAKENNKKHVNRRKKNDVDILWE
jgi:hypothetical protein